jgi:hypothetical protein
MHFMTKVRTFPLYFCVHEYGFLPNQVVYSHWPPQDRYVVDAAGVIHQRAGLLRFE